jgi:hypothetical protein
MILCEMNADNKIRGGRWHWNWRLHSFMVCMKCRKHIVTAGLDLCPTCGHRLGYLPNLPKKGAAAWKRAQAYYTPLRFLNNKAVLPDYPTAIPRRLPTKRCAS